MKRKKPINVNKKELARRMAKSPHTPYGTAYEAMEYLKAFEEVVTNALLNEERVSMVGFLSFEPIRVGSRVRQDPRNLDVVKKPAGLKLRIKPQSKLLTAIKNVQFEEE